MYDFEHATYTYVTVMYLFRSLPRGDLEVRVCFSFIDVRNLIIVQRLRRDITWHTGIGLRGWEHWICCVSSPSSAGGI